MKGSTPVNVEDFDFTPCGTCGEDITICGGWKCVSEHVKDAPKRPYWPEGDLGDDPDGDIDGYDGTR